MDFFFFNGHETVIELGKNESRLYRLPPMSADPGGRSIVIDISQSTRDDLPGPDDGEPGVPHPEWIRSKNSYGDIDAR